MDALLLNLGKLAVGFLCMLGPIAFLTARLRARDRRDAALTLTVLRELNAPELRGLYSVNVVSRSFGRDSVAIDLLDCSREQAWDVMEKVTIHLPPRVRVEINGIRGGRLRPVWTLTAPHRFPSPALCP